MVCRQRFDGPSVSDANRSGRQGIDAAVEQMAQPKILRKFAARLAISKLADHVGEDERVQRIATGDYDGGSGLLVLTDRRLLFVKEGLTRSATEDFPLERIASVQWSAGLVHGKIRILVSGNTTNIEKVWKDDGKAMVGLLRDRLRPPS
jgi:Bacterial PH domain